MNINVFVNAATPVDPQELAGLEAKMPKRLKKKRQVYGEDGEPAGCVSDLFMLIYVCIHTHIYMCIHIYTHTHTHIYIYIYIYIYTYIHIYIFEYTYMYIYMR